MITAFGAIFLAISAFYAIRRLIGNQRSSDRLNDTLYRIQKDPASAATIADQLDCFVGRIPFSVQADLKDVAGFLSKSNQLNAFKIHGVFDADKQKILVVTTLSEDDFEVGRAGTTRNVTNLFQRNFAIQRTADREALEIYAHQYKTREEERLLKSFTKALSQTDAVTGPLA